MAIGLGIILILLGLLFAFDVVSIPGMDQYVATETLGWILLAVGALALVVSLVANKQRSETHHVEERRGDVR